MSERLANAKSYAEMVEVVEAYLVRRVARATQDVLPVDRAAARLTADARHIWPDWLAREARLSPRQFNRKFTERIGVGPKLYSRLVRYHRVYLFKAAHPAIAWPTVAIECGYTDYRYLVRDFRPFTDATPTSRVGFRSQSQEYKTKIGKKGDVIGRVPLLGDDNPARMVRDEHIPFLTELLINLSW